MIPSPLSCETRWLRKVLATLGDVSAAAASRPALEDLSDRLSALTWDDGCPNAATFVRDGDHGRFRRHPLASINARHCSALLMYWPAGHATLPHDHGGLWGIEVAIDGTLDIEEYVRTGDARQPALSAVKSYRLAPGQAAVFSGAQYVHRCRNRSNANAALTLHVYGGDLRAYTAFGNDATGRLTALPQIARNDGPLS